MMNGYSATRAISGVLIEGLEISGRAINSAAEASLFSGHVQDLRFRPRAGGE